jgi:hypothetical protein
MAAFLPALRYLGGLPHETAARVGVLALAAAIGALPGAIFGLRLKRAYSSLPAALRKLRYTASTGRDIERARWEAWAPFQRYPAGPRPQESLIALYRMAHQDAWMRERAGLAFSAPFLTNALETGTWLGQARLAPGMPRLAGAQDGLPPFLDGFDSAPRAAAVSAAQAEGAARRFADLAFHVDRLYAFEGIAIATKPATTVTLDAEGRPHSETGPAVTWTDGTQICAWHGDPIPADLLDRGMPLTAAYISREFDPVRRRVLIERFGLGRYLLEAGAQEIHRDCFGRLYRLVHRTGESIQAVRVVNHSPEPDGSFREYWLRVPPAIATAREAVAWTFGMLPEEYDPVSQS